MVWAIKMVATVLSLWVRVQLIERYAFSYICQNLMFTFVKQKFSFYVQQSDDNGDNFILPVFYNIIYGNVYLCHNFKVSYEEIISTRLRTFEPSLNLKSNSTENEAMGW